MPVQALMVLAALPMLPDGLAQPAFGFGKWVVLAGGSVTHMLDVHELDVHVTIPPGATAVAGRCPSRTCGPIRSHRRPGHEVGGETSRSQVILPACIHAPERL